MINVVQLVFFSKCSTYLIQFCKVGDKFSTRGLWEVGAFYSNSILRYLGVGDGGSKCEE